MKKTARASFLLAVLGVLAADKATAQPPGPPPGGPGRPGGPGGPGGFGPGTFLAPRIIEDADTDKDGRLSPQEAARAAEKLIREADADKKGSLDAAALGRAINQRIAPPGDVPPGDVPPGGFGPGTFLAPRILAAADADKDGRLSPEEAAKAAEKFVREADPAGKGPLDGNALADAMNRRMGPPGGPGGMMGPDRAIVKTFDKDGNGRLDTKERGEARASLKKDRPAGGGRGFGPPPGMGGGERVEGKPGPRVALSDVKPLPGKPLYDPSVIRTLFLDFEEKDWEEEIADFYRTDVEVPATLTVDGKKYPGVGVQFRGLSSFMGVRPGSKRSLNLSLDLVDPKQRLLGYKSLNLLNSHDDPTFLHSVLFFDIARRYIPAPKANFVKVVINGESWGLYVNAQQFDRIFLAEHYPDSKGTRWKVKGNPGGGGGLDYVGDDLEPYKRRYEIKSGEDEKAWKALVQLCRTLSQTPPERLEAELKPILDVEGVLRFLALDNALINSDGYWIRASDYNIYRDSRGLFHVIPHDANETFQPPMGPGFGMMGGRPGGGPRPAGGPPPAGVDLDPLIGLDDARKPLRSKLLAVPALRDRYLRHVAEIADRWLDWGQLGPIVARYRTLIGPEVEADTRKLSSAEAFARSVADAPAAAENPPGRGRTMPSLREFADRRRKYLLDYPGIMPLKP